VPSVFWQGRGAWCSVLVCRARDTLLEPEGHKDDGGGGGLREKCGSLDGTSPRWLIRTCLGSLRRAVHHVLKNITSKGCISAANFFCLQKQETFWSWSGLLEALSEKENIACRGGIRKQDRTST